MSMLAKVREQRVPVLFGALLLLLAAGSVSSKLLTARTPGNIKALIGSGPQSTYGGLPTDKEAGAGGPIERNMKMLKDSGAQTPAPDLPPLQDRIIKTGSITLKVKKGKFTGTYEQVIMVAQANGGYVAGSNSLAANDRLASGTLTIKIPSKNFELALAKLRRLGKMTAMDINSRDVSTEFVDLESRLRHWRAQETILLNLMSSANTVADSIAIQQQLSQVQMEIEQITGRLNYLKDQTSFSSVQVTITEPGVAPKPLDPWGVKSAVSQSAHAFVDTINGLIVLAGYLSPLALMGGLAGLIWLGLRRRTAAAA